MKKTIITIALGATLLATTLSAGGHGGRGGHHKGGMLPFKIIYHLDLSDMQEDKIEGIIDGYKKQRRTQQKSTIKEEHKNMYMQNMQEIFKGKSFNKALFIQKNTERMQKHIQAQASMMEEILSVLDESQTKAFYDKINTLEQDMDKNFFEHLWSKF